MICWSSSILSLLPSLNLFPLSFQVFPLQTVLHIYISHGTLLHHWLCTRIDAPVNLLEHWELEVCWHELLIGTSVKGNVHFKHVHQMITGLHLSYIIFAYLHPQIKLLFLNSPQNDCISVN